MDEIKAAVINRLETLEAEAEDHIQFWLSHSYLLHPDTEPTRLLDFLGVSNQPLLRPLWFAEDFCEDCYANAVVSDKKNDDWICAECGAIQDFTRTPFKRYIPESSIYKHETHLHQVLYALQCLRQKLPNDLVENVHLYLELENKPVTYKEIQKALRPLGYKQHYAMIPAILSEIDPTYKPLRITRAQEEQLHGMFFQYISLGRVEGMDKNRLNYHYVIYQISHLLSYSFIVPYLRIPKGEKSRRRHDQVWRHICGLLKWDISLCHFKY
jgi:hypothetical protein